MSTRNAFQVLEEISERLGRIAGRRKSVVYFDPPSLFIPDFDDLRGASLMFDQRDALRAVTRNNVALHVVATSGLTVPLNGPLTSNLVQLAGLRLLSAEALEALRLPLAVSGIPLDVFAAPFRGTAPKTGSVLVGAQIAGADLALGPGEIMEVGYRAMDAEGKTTPGAFTRFELVLKPESRTAAAASGLRFAEWMTLPVGRHQVRFVASQPSGRTGMVVADVEVPDYEEEPVSVSGILLASERTAPQQTLKGDDTLKKVLGGDPTAVRRFSRRDMLAAYVEVCTNPKTSLTGLTGSVTRVGTTRTQPAELRTVSAVAGRTALTTRLRLTTLQPGDYVLAYEAKAGKRVVKREVLFTVTE